MGKEDIMVLRGKLVRKPRAGFSYARTRKAIIDTLLGFMVDGKNRLVEEVGGVKIDEDKVDIPMRVNKHFLGARDEQSRQEKISEILIKLEALFNIGGGIEGDTGAEARIEKMEAEGIIPVAYWTEMEMKDFEA